MPTVEAYIAALSSEQAAVAEHLRRIILSSDPRITERISYKVPFYRCDGLLCYISTRRGRVYVGLCPGVHLSDAYGLLEAEGRKEVRSVTLSSLRDLAEKEEAIRFYVQESLRWNALKKVSKW